ncbi:MAG: hypothetical protein HQ507_03445 [Candidatus Marinimicrobia bacterium]|nr:hypothetical protein [Candidatus Neomarinimicrobiota bacterium]
MPESLFKAFFSGGYDVTTFSNHQLLDFEGLKGRLLSSSYIPSSDHRNYHPMLRNLKQVFEEHQTDGQVKIEYQTELYLGRFK